MVRTLVLLFAILLVSTAGAQQGWQWGKRGGGSADNAVISTGEDIVDMATDNAGNVYALANMNSDGFPTLDGADTVSGANTSFPAASLRLALCAGRTLRMVDDVVAISFFPRTVSTLGVVRWQDAADGS